MSTRIRLTSVGYAYRALVADSALVAVSAIGGITAVGSMTSGDTFADTSADDDWLGLGAAAGRIEFDDQTPDEVNILDANVGIGTASPDAAALLEVTSTTKGFLPPRMTTTQRDAISSPPAGLMIYNTTTNKLNFYNGSAWEAVTSL